VEFLLVVSEDEEDGFRHVEGDEAEEGTALLIFPSGGSALAVVVGVASFPDEVVFVADAFEVGAGPAGDVLEGFPVGLAIGRVGIEPSGFAGDAVGFF